MELDLGKTLQDTAYITVGVGVLGVQQAQLRRRELQRAIREQTSTTSTRVQEGVADARNVVTARADRTRAYVVSQRGAATARAREVRSDLCDYVEPIVRAARERVEPLAEQLRSVPEQAGSLATRGRELVTGLRRPDAGGLSATA